MDKDKKSFVFYVEWRDVLMDYPAEVRYEVYDAIIEYAASGKLSELKPLAKMAFSFIKKDMDRNQEKYNGKVETNRENGKKGGAPLGNSNARRKQPKTTETTQNNRTVEQTTETTLNENDNDNVNENGNNNPPSIPPLKSGDSVADAPDASETGAEEGGKIKTWRNDYETYRQLVEEGKKALLSDKELMKKQQSYYPGVNIPLSIEKACTNYWATEAGWKNKKGKRSKEINMKMTLVNAIKNNRVYETNKTESQSYDNGGFLD